jgi:hypothetical protein
MCIHRHTRPTSRARRTGSRGHQQQFRQRLREAFGWLVDREIWLRACAIAALRQRDGAVTLEPPGASARPQSHTAHACCHAAEPANGDKCGERPNIAATPSVSGSDHALVAVPDRALSSRDLSEGTLQAIGTGMGRPDLCASSCAARTNEWRRASMTRRWGSASRHMQQRSYLLLANWIVRAAHFLAARGLLSLTAARIAFRGSGSLSRRSMAIYRYERATSKDRLRMT